jgi:hypothetical protein
MRDKSLSHNIVLQNRKRKEESALFLFSKQVYKLYGVKGLLKMYKANMIQQE